MIPHFPLQISIIVFIEMKSGTGFSKAVYISYSCSTYELKYPIIVFHFLTCFTEHNILLLYFASQDDQLHMEPFIAFLFPVWGVRNHSLDICLQKIFPHVTWTRKNEHKRNSSVTQSACLARCGHEFRSPVSPYSLNVRLVALSSQAIFCKHHKIRSDFPHQHHK